MKRCTLVLLASLPALTLLAGCSANAEFNGIGKNSAEMTPTQLAAYAAQASYPQTQPSNDLRLAAIVDKGALTLKIYNWTGEPIRDAKLWVNESFMARIDGIAPNSKGIIKLDRFYDGIGNSFSAQKAEVSKVQLERDGQLHNLMGPSTE